MLHKRQQPRGQLMILLQEEVVSSSLQQEDLILKILKAEFMNRVIANAANSNQKLS